MKKLTIMGILLVMAAALCAQDNDSRIVWQGTEEGGTANLTYHLEVWNRKGNLDDVLPAINSKLLELRKYGSICFLVHAQTGYLVSLYASPEYNPQLIIPNTTKMYELVSNTKEGIREALAGRTFRQHITRTEFLKDLNVVFNGLK